MKRNAKKDKWIFPLAVPDGVTAFKPSGATARTRWIVQYKPTRFSRRVTERLSPDPKLAYPRILAVGQLVREGQADPHSARTTIHARKPLIGAEDDQAIEHVLAGETGNAAKLKTGHLYDYWKKELLAKGNTPKHAMLVYRRVRRAMEACGAERISDLVPSEILEAITELEDERLAGAIRRGGAAAAGGEQFKGKCPHCGRGHNLSVKGPCGRCLKRRLEGRSLDADELKSAPPLSNQTRNHYLKAVKQFSAWLAGAEHRARADLLKHLKGWNAKTDPRHPHQDLGEIAAAALVEAARIGVEVLGMSGIDRAWLYETAMESGFRSRELGTLTPRRCELDGEHPVLICKAGYSKHRREDAQPIAREFAARLKQYLKDRPLDEPVWRMPAEAIDLMRQDLVKAEIPYVDAEGRYADFHAFRHTYICRLVRSGAMPKETQVLARHSSIVLTMDYYAHLKLHDTSGAVNRLSPLTKPEAPQLQKATGTDGPVISSNDSPGSPQLRVVEHGATGGLIPAGAVRRSASSGAESGKSPAAGVQVNKALQDALQPSVRSRPDLSGNVHPGTEAVMMKNNENAPKPAGFQGIGEMQLAGVEPATFGSVDRTSNSPNDNPDQQLTPDGDAGRCTMRSKSTLDPDRLQAAVERVNDLLRQGRIRPEDVSALPLLTGQPLASP